MGAGTMLAHPTFDRPSRFAAFGFLGWLAGTAAWWALALAPLPAPPEWLDRARAVRFGSPPGGLPDTWGWMLLALGPLSLAAFLFAVWGRDLSAWARRLAGTVPGAILLGAFALPPLLLAGWLAQRAAALERAAAGPVALSAAEGSGCPPPTRAAPTRRRRSRSSTRAAPGSTPARSPASRRWSPSPTRTAARSAQGWSTPSRALPRSSARAPPR